MTILGIETSCDETALALIETRGQFSLGNNHALDEKNNFECRVIDSLVHSQAELHSAYGGVYPSLAKREHGKNLIPLLAKILDGFDTREEISEDEFARKMSELQKEISLTNPDLEQSIAHADLLKKIPKIDAIAVTEGPGLEPTLWVGINFARILGTLWNVPVIPINHMEGHIVGSLLESDIARGNWQELKKIKFPALALLISGGHTELVKIDGIGRYKILGQTKDDAVGEAFDKVARILGLPYPGGPHVSELAQKAEEEGIIPEIKLPRPMLRSNNYDFSFSGLKTAVLYATQKAQKEEKFTESYKKGIALEFERAVVEVLESKTGSAIEEISAQSLIVGGGVSANLAIRNHLGKLADRFRIPLFLPSRHISGDNALMIALVGALHGISAEQRPMRAQGTKRL